MMLTDGEKHHSKTSTCDRCELDEARAERDRLRIDCEKWVAEALRHEEATMKAGDALEAERALSDRLAGALRWATLNHAALVVLAEHAAARKGEEK